MPCHGLLVLDLDESLKQKNLTATSYGILLFGITETNVLIHVRTHRTRTEILPQCISWENSKLNIHVWYLGLGVED